MSLSCYYYNKLVNDKGKHEIHNISCQHAPLPENRVTIGIIGTYDEALTLAKSKEPNKIFEGCYYCCKSYHS